MSDRCQEDNDSTGRSKSDMTFRQQFPRVTCFFKNQSDHQDHDVIQKDDDHKVSRKDGSLRTKTGIKMPLNYCRTSSLKTPASNTHHGSHYIMSVILILVSCVNLANTQSHLQSLSDKRFWATSWTPMIAVTPDQVRKTTMIPFVETTSSPVVGAALSSSVNTSLKSSLEGRRPQHDSLEWQSSMLKNDKERMSSKSKQIRSKTESQLQSGNQVKKNRKTFPSIESGRQSQQDMSVAKSAANTVYFDHHLNEKKGIFNDPSSHPDNLENISSERPRKPSSVPPQKQVSWDDKIEFPSSTPATLRKLTWPATDSDEVSSTSTSLSSLGELGRLGSKPKSSSNQNQRWKTFTASLPSSSTSSLRISNRLGALRQSVSSQQTKTTPLVEDFKNKQNLKKLFDEAVAEMENNQNSNTDNTNGHLKARRGESSRQSSSAAKILSGKSGRIRSPVSSLRIMNERKSLLERSGLKTAGLKTLVREDVSNDNLRADPREREEDYDRVEDDVEDVSAESPNEDKTTTKPSRTTSKESWQDKWPNAKVTQYFSWETPSTNDDGNKDESGGREDTTPAPTTTTTSNSRSNAGSSSANIKGRRRGSQRITTTTEEPTTTIRTTTTRIVEELPTVRPSRRENRVFSANIKTTVNQPFQRIRVSSSTRRPPETTTLTTTTELESSSEETTPSSRLKDNTLDDLKKTYEDWSRDAVNDRSGKGSSLVSHSGNGYEWTADIDHSNQRPPEIRTRTTQRTNAANLAKSTKGTSNNFFSSSEDVGNNDKISGRVTGTLEVEDEANDDSLDITTEAPVFTRIRINKVSNNQGIKRRGQLKSKKQQQVSPKARIITTTEREETTTTAPTTRQTPTAARVERLQVKGRQTKSKTNQRQTTKGLPQVTQERQVTQVKVSGAIKTANQGVEYLEDTQEEHQQNQENNSFQQNSFEQNDRLRKREENALQGIKGEQIKSDQVKSEQVKTGGQFNKKSGVDYSSASIEREEDISSVRDIGYAQKSGEQVDNENENCRLEDAIPGLPLRDYPTYDLVPETSFRCSDQTLPGYYGDVEAQCQVKNNVYVHCVINPFLSKGLPCLSSRWPKE